MVSLCWHLFPIVPAENIDSVQEGRLLALHEIQSRGRILAEMQAVGQLHLRS